METPETRLAEAIDAIKSAGGVILGVEPLAHPDAPHVLAAHRVRPGYPSLAVADAVSAAVRAHEVPIDGLIPWEPEAIEEPEAVSE